MTRYKNKFWRVVVLFSCLLAVGCSFNEERIKKDPVLKITMAVSKVASSSLIVIADEKGYFKEEGLEAIIAISIPLVEKPWKQ